MKIAIRLFFLLMMMCSGKSIFAQNITGRWEGVMHGSGGTFLQMNVEQRGYELCGYTYDYVMYDKTSYCRAKLEGRYDGKKNLGLMIGTVFIANSGNHVLMRIKLWRQQGDSRNTLRAVFVQESLFSSFFGGGGDEEMFIMKKVSATPGKLPANIPPCFPKKPVSTTAPVTKAKPLAGKPIVAKPTVTKPAIVKQAAKPPVTTAKATAVKPVTTPAKPVVQVPVTHTPVQPVVPQNLPVVIKPSESSSSIVRQMNTRKKSEQSRIVINTNHINLKLYDNGTVDNDSVSVFYNGRLLLSHQRLSEKAIEISLDLDEGVQLHEITMYAENLGSLPPNTALVVVTAGNKRYELRSKASLEENAVLIFEYKKE